MIKTGLIFVYFWVFLLFYLFFSPPGIFFLLTGMKKKRARYMGFLARIWSRHFLWLVGAKVSVSGSENVPRDDRVCFIANHQSGFDILLILAYSGKGPGFIAKKELLYAPFLNLWMVLMRCVFIERRNVRKSLLAIEKGVESLRDGNPMAIFPEGTRSRDGKMGDFKPGSLKLATRAEAVVVPVTLSGTAGLYEKTGFFSSGSVIMTIHPPIPTEGLSREEGKALSQRVRAVIASALPEEVRS
jgi:1-acyl-sn-glycerol-3-phosphate acyltransferase